MKKKKDPGALDGAAVQRPHPHTRRPFAFFLILVTVVFFCYPSLFSLLSCLFSKKIFVDSWAEVPRLMADLVADPAALDELQRRNMAW